MLRLTAVSTTFVFLLAVAVPAAVAAPADGHDSDTGRVVWTNAPDNTFSVGHLVSARPGGGGFRMLTPDTPGVNDIDASTAPNGEQIVFQRDHGDSTHLRIVDAEGRHDHALRLGCSDPCLADVAPVWLGNGRIAFTRLVLPFDPGGFLHSAVLYTARPDGSEVRRLSTAGIDGRYEDSYARLSPGRDYITFLRQRNADGAVALYRMTPHGGHVRQLTPFGPHIGNYDLSPARSGPTADLLAFDTFREGQTSLDIATVPATCAALANCAAKIRFLTHNAGGARRNGNPTWSPDGKRLAFTERDSIDDVDANIVTARPDATDRRLVSRSPLFDYRPDWGVAD